MTGPVLDWAVLAPGLVAGLLVLATHVPLGQAVLRRGIIFIDLAVAQVAGLGVVAAHLYLHEPGAWLVQAAAFVAALGVAGVFYLGERFLGHLQEALIGVIYVLASVTALLLLANSSSESERLRDLLVGQLLWVGWGDLGMLLAISLIVLIAWFRWGAKGGPLVFYLAFAPAITGSVQLVGVYLVFSALVLPAMAGYAWPERRRLPVGYAVGVSGLGAGLLLSLKFDLPSGPTVVWCLAVASALLALLGLMLRPRPA